MSNQLSMLLKEYETKKNVVKEAKKEYEAFSDFDNEDAFEEVSEKFHNAESERDYIANIICNYLLDKQMTEK